MPFWFPRSQTRLIEVEPYPEPKAKGLERHSFENAGLMTGVFFEVGAILQRRLFRGPI